jgi:PHP domain
VTDPGLAAGRSPDIVLEGRFVAADRMRYVLVPFQVTPGLRQLEIRYSYSDQIDSDPLVGGGNTLDIGLFDPRGTGTGSVGFRGWSGSHKDAFVVGEDWATPPYAAGPMPAGIWNVLLGPYKVGPRGCDYRVEIRLDPGLAAVERDLVRTGAPPRPVLPAARPGWLRGDLHCHTRYSDGDSWPTEMLHAAAEAALDFLGVTDHNNVAHHAEYGPGGGAWPIVIPGVEVTTYGGHWNAWGTDRWWEFREPTGPAVDRAMRAAAEAGALVSVNHPKPFGPAWEYDTVGGAHAVEVWNGPWAGLNSAALEFWERRLRLGQRLTAVGGSDTHMLRTADPDLRHSRGIGGPTTWVDAGARPDVAAILDAMRAGRTFVSASPAGPQLYLDLVGDRLEVEVRGGQGTALVLAGDHGVVDTAAVPEDERTMTFAVSPSTYIRAQLIDSTGDVMALTSPIWLD